MLDRSLSLLREGFLFILNRRRQMGADAFMTRLMLKKSVCMGGSEAARLFYDSEHFQRAGAVPDFVQDTLFGRHAVQTMDDADFLHRKALFTRLLDEAQAERFASLLTSEWKKALIRWRYTEKPIILFEQAREIICHAICHWAGIMILEGEARSRSQDMFAMIDSFGSVVGPRHWRGVAARKRSEEWMTGLIEATRRKTPQNPDAPLNIIASYRNADDSLLDAKMAAIEMLNILRPAVAISYYVSFAALALHHYPHCREKIMTEEGYLDMFINEVRRFYPFAPFIGARARKEFSWKGCPFSKGTMAILDIYGTNHDAKIWGNPEEFRPERFRNWKDSSYELIPQGAGNASTGHRCPGESFTMAAMRVALNILVSLRYALPPQDLGFDLSRMPTYPRSGVVIRLGQGASRP